MFAAAVPLRVKRPAHSAAEPGYCARRTGLTAERSCVPVHSASNLPPEIRKVMYATNACHARPCQLPTNWRTVNRNRFKVSAISAVIGVISTLLVGLTASPASAATPECNRARVTTAAPNTPSGRYLYLPTYQANGDNYLCWMAYGTRNDGVGALQGAINLCYNSIPNIDVDRIYGGDTRTAVRAVQTQHGIHVDGEYGPDTYSAMKFPLYRTVDNQFSGTCL